MITKFDSLYAGHVDMTDVGYGGTAVNDRIFDNEHLMTVYSKAEAIAKTLDENGFDTMWMAEHHFQPEGYECIPNLIMLNVHLAHLTKNIKFGCGFNIAPMWHPLRLAEDYAMADILTNGRVIFGVGRGYHSREVESFGNPIIDQAANRELFEEQVEVIMKAFHQPSFSHHGKYYDIPPRVPYRGYELEEITLVPRPRNLPVECYQPIVSASQRAMDFMVKHGIKGIIGGGAAGLADFHHRAAPRAADVSRRRQFQICFSATAPFHSSGADAQQGVLRGAVRADGRGVGAAFMLGAGGVQLGTAFLRCDEANISDAHRAALGKSDDTSTVVTDVVSGRPARMITNRLVEELSNSGARPLPFPAQWSLTLPLGEDDDHDFIDLLAGQSVALTREMPAADLVRTLAAETSERLKAFD
ncbi:MAG: LLM class flavin-dependent oxidoreductase [Gemmatimonadetes bacterium]|nr:LLM class flavin-dependent oxidoreductase [Gemmatimonadota bacterium]